MQELPINRFRELLSNASDIAVITHRNADLDSFSSAYAVFSFLRSLGKSATLIVPDGPSGDVKAVLSKISLKPEYLTSVKCGDLAIMVDVGGSVQVGGVECSKTVVFDHHRARSVRGILEFVDPEASSTAEVVSVVLRELGYRPSREEALLLLAAIIDESGRFLRASKSTFNVVEWLLESGGLSYGEALSLLSRPMDESLKFALVKGVVRATAYRFGRSILCVSFVNAYEGQVAGRLLDVGCDIAVVAGEHEGEVRVSLRSRGGLGTLNLALKLAERLGGVGGGHEGASLVVVKQPVTQVRIVREVLNAVKEVYGASPVEVS